MRPWYGESTGSRAAAWSGESSTAVASARCPGLDRTVPVVGAARPGSTSPHAALTARGVRVEAGVGDHGWGRLVTLRLPGGGALGI